MRIKIKKTLSVLLCLSLFSAPGSSPIAAYAQCDWSKPENTKKPEGELPQAYDDKAKMKKEIQDLNKKMESVQDALSRNRALLGKASAAQNDDAVQRLNGNISRMKGLKGSLDDGIAQARQGLQKSEAVIEKASGQGQIGVAYGRVGLRSITGRMVGAAPATNAGQRQDLMSRKRMPKKPVLGTIQSRGTITVPLEPGEFQPVQAGGILSTGMSAGTPSDGCGGVHIGPAEAKMPPNSVIAVTGDCGGKGSPSGAAGGCNVNLQKGGAMIDTTGGGGGGEGGGGEGDGGRGSDTSGEGGGGGGAYYRPLTAEGGTQGSGGISRKTAKLMAFALVIGAAVFIFTKAKVAAKKEKDGGSSVVVMEGEVKAVDKDGKNEMILKPGQEMKVGPDGLFSREPAKVNFAKLNRWWEEKGLKEMEEEDAEEALPPELAASEEEEDEKEKAAIKEEKAPESKEGKPAVEEKLPGKAKAEMKAEGKPSKEKEKPEEPKKPAKKKGVSRRAE